MARRANIQPGIGFDCRRGRGPFDHQGSVEPVDQRPKFGQIDVRAPFVEGHRTDFDEGGPAIKVADDPLKEVKGDENLALEQSPRVFQGDEGRAPMVDPLNGEGAKLGAVE